MGLFTRKKEKVIEDYVTRETEGAEVWIVSWDARWGEYGNKKRVAKCFLNKNDADTLVESLKEAKALLQYTEPINITVEKQS